MAQKPNRFLFSSDYPTPYLILDKTISFTAKKASGGVWGQTKYKVKHNLPFIPMLLGYWSTSSNYVPSYDISTRNVEFSSTALQGFYHFKYTADFSADDTYIYVDVDNYTNSDVIVYAKLTGLAPFDYNGNLPIVQDKSDFNLNTDFNYKKIYQQGKVDIAASNFKVTVNHNLGYVPQCKAWVQRLYYDEYGVQTSEVIGDALQNGITRFSGGDVDSNAICIDSTKLYFESENHDDEFLYYIIYGDEV